MADIPSTPADGNVKVVWVPAIADPDAPTVAEVTGASAVDVSCYLTGDGWNPGLDEQTISDDRLCSRETFEQAGRSSRTLTVRYVINPTDPTNNKAQETFVPGTQGFFVVRPGTDYEPDLAASDNVRVWPVSAGQMNELPPEANSVLKAEQRMFVRGPVRMNATIGAA